MLTLPVLALFQSALLIRPVILRSPALESRGLPPPSVAVPNSAGYSTGARNERVASERDSVALTVRRLDQGDGDIAVANAIPLAQGMLRPRDVSRTRLEVNGREVDAAIVPTTALHPDGTLRSVVVQFSYSLQSADRIPAVLRLKAGPSRTPKIVPAFEVISIPGAVALPENPEYLIATGLVGPTISARESKAQGGPWSRYEADFVEWADRHWSSSGASWSAGNYYDRAQIYYAWWVRTGNVEYWRRATLMAIDYRTNYLEKNEYSSSHHWSQLEGVALHYVLTGDERSRLAVERTARILASYFRRGSLGRVQHHDMESRIQARSLLAALLAWETQKGGGEVRGAGFPVSAEVADAAEQWERDLPRMLEQILSAQANDGGFLWGGYCGASINYMIGLLNDVLIRYHARFRADSAIVSSVRRSGEWLRSTQWRSDGTFNYQSQSCARNQAGPSGATDLNLLMVTTYGWLYHWTGDVRYRAFGDQVFAAGVNKSFLRGTKQFNEQYTSSYRYLAYRRSATLR